MESTNQLWPVLVPILTAALSVERGVEVFWNYVELMLTSARNWQPADFKGAQYIQFKSGTSLLISMIAGVLVANFTGMLVFEQIKPLATPFLDNMPQIWDVIITGIIIGAGAKPAHDILGIVTQFKGFLANTSLKQREMASAALAEGVLKLAQSDAASRIEVPGVGPTRMQSAMPGGMTRGIAPAGEGEDDETQTVGKSQTEQYIEILRQGVAR
ncbi:MAG: hypothetical protein AAF639_39590 [Chloroflexota bacterium]